MEALQNKRQGLVFCQGFFLTSCGSLFKGAWRLINLSAQCAPILTRQLAK